MIELLCGFCGEPIDGPECPLQGSPQHLHQECGIRLVIGSVAHLERRCGCYVAGSEEGDPPHLTLRQAAHAAVTLHNCLRARN